MASGFVVASLFGLAVFLSVGHAASAATPGKTAPAAVATTGRPIGPTEDVLWNQYESGNYGSTGTPSQNSEVDPRDSWAADDFVVPAGQRWHITGVDLRGFYTGTGSNATSANVYFFGPCGNLPCGDWIGYSSQPLTGGPNDFRVDFNGWYLDTGGSGTFWVTVQVNLSEGSGNRRWNWWNRSGAQNNFGAAWVNVGNLWGTNCTNWTRRTSCFATSAEPDQVFLLRGTNAAAPPPPPPPPPPPALQLPPPPGLPTLPPNPPRRVPRGVAVVGRALTYRGDDTQNIVDVVRSGRFFVITTNRRLRVGGGCRRLDLVSAKCAAGRVRSFFASAGAGDDSVAATITLPSTLLGGPGSDHLEGGPGGDLLKGEAGQDTVDGGPGRDTVYGDGSDVLIGGDGDDALFADGGGEGELDGDSGNDLLRGGDGVNFLLGGDGDDYMDGAPGNDRLFGGGGADILVGGIGDDAITGNRAEEGAAGVSDGTDLLFCGPGVDRADPLDPTQRFDDATCELFSWVGGVGGGYTAPVSKHLHRPRSSAPYLEARVDPPAKPNDRFKLDVTCRASNGQVVARASKIVKGLRWVTFRNLPPSVRKVEVVAGSA
jgi:hypothetical protein